MSDERVEIDPKRLRATSARAELPVRTSKKPPRHRAGEKFLKGPIPMSWLTIAASLPGKALQVAVGIWYWAGIKRTREIALSISWLSNLRVDRFSGYRGLAALEKAGLVSVVRHPGRKPIVTLLDASPNDARAS
jgi:hypothetical protein